MSVLYKFSSEGAAVKYVCCVHTCRLACVCVCVPACVCVFMCVCACMGRCVKIQGLANDC